MKPTSSFLVSMRSNLLALFAGCVVALFVSAQSFTPTDVAWIGAQDVATATETTTPSYVGYGTNNIDVTASPTLNYPTVQQNDIMIAVMAFNSIPVIANSPPTGWTFLSTNVSGTDSLMASYWKRAGASEPDSEEWTELLLAVNSGVSVVVAYRGCKESGSPINTSAFTNSAAGTAWDSLTITTTKDKCRVVCFFGGDQEAGVSFTWDGGIDERFDVDINPGLGYITCGDTEKATAGNISMGGDITSSDAYNSAIIALEPK
jgi:hypothetical protein